MTPIIKNSGNISTGEIHTYNVKLATDSFQRLIDINSLGFTKASVKVQTAGATGTSGNLLVKQSVAKGDIPTAFAVPVSLALGTDVTLSAFDIEVTGSTLVIELPAGLGNVGNLTLDIVLKR